MRCRGQPVTRVVREGVRAVELPANRSLNLDNCETITTACKKSRSRWANSDDVRKPLVGVSDRVN